MSYYFAIVVLIICSGSLVYNDLASEQIVDFKKNTFGPVGVMRTSYGVPIDNNTADSSLNQRIIYNRFFLDSMTHFVRQRIPVRVVHAKGTGAFGYFVVTHHLSDVCKAKVFSKVGKKTPVAVRFSPVSTEKGGSDNGRQPRGFAVKFYTEEGNFDMLGLNTPMFAIKDPLFFPGFVSVQKPNPVTGLKDPNMLWDFITQRPESLNVFMYLFSDRGEPHGYRYMPGFGVHTFQVVNAYGISHVLRFHLIPEAGIKNYSAEEVLHVAAIDPDYANRDLYNAIESGNYPSWSVGVQVLSMDDVKNAPFNVFDITLVLPLKKYPLRPLGRLVLNRNPSNMFAQMENIAFSPGHLISGIVGAPDKIFESRIFAYRDALNYRLGTNFNKIPVNKPIMKPYTYNRDGVQPLDENEWGIPNYYPNSFHGPQPYTEKNNVQIINIYEGPPDNFNQICEIYANDYGADEKTRIINNIVTSLGPVTQVIQDRAIRLLSAIDPMLGRRVWQGLQTNTTTYH